MIYWSKIWKNLIKNSKLDNSSDKIKIHTDDFGEIEMNKEFFNLVFNENKRDFRD